MTETESKLQILANWDETDADYLVDNLDGIIVDWRDDEDGIVDQIAARVPEPLTHESNGDDIILSFEGSRQPAGLTISLVDRSVIICAMNRIMRGRYEIRAIREEIGAGDTIAICVQPAADWAVMEERYPDKTRHAFVKFVEGVNVFNVRSADEMDQATPRPWDEAVRESREAQQRARNVTDNFKAATSHRQPLAGPKPTRNHWIILALFALLAIAAVMYVVSNR